jgi:hypothetical protein
MPLATSPGSAESPMHAPPLLRHGGAHDDAASHPIHERSVLPLQVAQKSRCVKARSVIRRSGAYRVGKAVSCCLPTCEVE